MLVKKNIVGFDNEGIAAANKLVCIMLEQFDAVFAGVETEQEIFLAQLREIMAAGKASIQEVQAENTAIKNKQKEQEEEEKEKEEKATVNEEKQESVTASDSKE